MGYSNEFKEAISNDLNTPEALAVVWKLIRDESVFPADKYATLLGFDKVLGLDLEHNEFEIKEIPGEVQKLVDEREETRTAGNYQKADELREHIESLGFVVEDTLSGPKISKS